MRLRGSLVTTSNQQLWEHVLVLGSRCLSARRGFFFIITQLVSNQKQARVLTITPEAMARTKSSCFLATRMYWLDKHRGLSQFSEAGCRVLMFPDWYRLLLLIEGFSAWGNPLGKVNVGAQKQRTASTDRLIYAYTLFSLRIPSTLKTPLWELWASAEGRVICLLHLEGFFLDDITSPWDCGKLLRGTWLPKETKEML